MKKFIGNTFEPLWFVLCISVFSVKMIDPAFRRLWRHMRAQHRSGRSFTTIMRLTSKRAAQSMPIMMPGVLLVGALVGSLGGVGAAVGSAVSFALMVALPLLAPMPSAAMELEQFRH